MGSVHGQQPGYHFVGDPARIHRDAESIVQVGRPLGRAHALHGPRGLRPPCPPGRGHQLAARSVPQLLGFHQHAVQVEDHRVDHRHILTCLRCGLGCDPWHSLVMARNRPRQPIETVVEIGGPTIRRAS